MWLLYFINKDKGHTNCTPLQPKQKWDTPETLSIPGTHAYYTLVSLTFHQASPVATADPFPDPGGHFSSLLRHIGASDVLAYDDLRNPVLQPATAKQNKEFTTGNMRHALAAAIYYLVGGEATQEALYQQHLEYLNTHFWHLHSATKPHWTMGLALCCLPVSPYPWQLQGTAISHCQSPFQCNPPQSLPHTAETRLQSSQAKAKVYRCSDFTCFNLPRTSVATHTCGSNRAILCTSQGCCPSQEADCV
jgi:hypothetical protein